MTSVPDDLRDHIRQAEESLGYTFEEPHHLLKALVHRSFRNERDDLHVDNERYEYLGDAVWELLIRSELVKRSSQGEGILTVLSSKMANRHALATLATKLGLEKLILLGRGELQSGGSHKPSILSNTLESVLGAIFMDGGFDAVERFFAGLPIQLGGLIAQGRPLDNKSRLQERTQHHLKVTPRYRLVAEEGPDHDRFFTAEVMVTDDLVATGEGRTKKDAEQEAAGALLAEMDGREVLP